MFLLILRIDNHHYNSMGILPDFLKGRLLLGTRAVNVRPDSKYNNALYPSLRRVADRKRAEITETTTAKNVSNP